MKLRFLFLITLLGCTTPLFPIFIIIHGSFASDRSWWTPQGRFFQEVESQARLLGESTIPWCWSGYPSFTQIERGGQMLAKFLMSLPRNERVTIIAHSNGGNVVNIASAILQQPVEKICGQFGAASVADVLEAAYSKLNDIPIPTTGAFVVPLPTTLYDGLDYTHTLREVPMIKGAITDYRAKLRKVNIIDRAIYLGTPVDMQVYPPQMDVIGTLINLYSQGDSIQQVAGLFSRNYPPHPRRVNLQVFMKRHDRALMTSPSHSDLHVPYIGRWLPYIPEVLAATDQGNNNFKDFAFKQDGIVIFDENTGPRYCRTKQLAPGIKVQTNADPTTKPIIVIEPVGPEPIVVQEAADQSALPQEPEVPDLGEVFEGLPSAVVSPDQPVQPALQQIVV